MVDNEPAPKKGEFNIWDFVSNDPIRPTMTGVFHDKENKMAVATDAHMLVADRASYDESNVEPNGHRWAIDKYGKFIEGMYVTWKSVVPEKEKAIEKGYEHYHVNVKDVDEYIKKCNAYMKLNGYTGKHAKLPVYNVPNSKLWFLASYFRTFLIASGGDAWLNNNNPNNAAAINWTDERIVLLMPMAIEDPEKISYGDGIYLN